MHEVKFDAWRVQLHKAGKDVRIYSRNGHDLTKRFINIAAAMLTAPAKTLVLDWELVVSDAADRPDFHTLHWRSFNVDQVSVWCLDLLFLNGQELTAKPLSDRKARLASLFESYRSRRLRHRTRSSMPRLCLRNASGWAWRGDPEQQTGQHQGPVPTPHKCAGLDGSVVVLAATELATEKHGNTELPGTSNF